MTHDELLARIKEPDGFGAVASATGQGGRRLLIMKVYENQQALWYAPVDRKTYRWSGLQNHEVIREGLTELNPSGWEQVLNPKVVKPIWIRGDS